MASPARLIGLVSLTALLAWALWEASWQPQLPTAPGPVSAADAVAGAPTAPVTPLGDYAVTLQRPLFYPGRRVPSDSSADAPSAAATTPVGRASNPLPSLSAVIEEGERRSALLTLPGQATSTRLSPGEELGGWRLVRIEDDSVTVESNGRREQIPLRRYGSAAGPTPIRPANNRAPRFVPKRAGTDDLPPPE